jgi:hypothetical protein
VDPEALVMIRMPPEPPKATPKPKTTKGEAQRREMERQMAAASSEDELDHTQIRFSGSAWLTPLPAGQAPCGARTQKPEHPNGHL